MQGLIIGNISNTYKIKEGTYEISDRAFWACDLLKEIIIPDSVVYIGVSAFQNCINLKEVSIGNNVVSIGDEAFRCCDSLSSVKIPNSVTSIGNNAFLSCSSMTSVTIGNSTYNVKCATYLGAGSKHGTVEEGVLAYNTISYPSLLQVYLSRMAKNDTVEALDGNQNGKYDILVLSQATQTNGFVNTTNGYENATLALDTAFGDVTKATAANWLVQVLPQD